MLPEIICQICSDNGIDILPSNSNYYDPDENCIKYCSRLTGEELLYTLLHELGHALQHQVGSYNKYYDFISTQYRTKKNTSVYMYCEMVCEYDAWERGREVAKQYNIPIDEDKYIKYAALNTKMYLKNYFKEMLPKRKK